MSNKWRTDNREHYRQWQKEYGRRNKRKFKDYNLRRNYGITIEQFDELLKEQGGKCACCRSEHGDSRRTSLHVDHCHITGDVRGLLCSECNLIIGRMRDSVGVAMDFAGYLHCTASIESCAETTPFISAQARALIKHLIDTGQI